MRPRGDATDYPAHAAGAGVTLAARVLPADQVRKLFATDLNRAGYVVVELAIYPEPGKSADIATPDFLLGHGSAENSARASTPPAIAAMLTQSSEAQNRGMGGAVYPSGSVGYETGTDPATGRRVNVTSAEVGMGAGTGPVPGAPPPPPGVRAYERDTVVRDLSDKAFPEGPVTEPTAGYLYFPKPAKKAKGPFDLTWYAPSGKVHLSVPQPEKK
jgi:hypothetical protein